MIAPETSVFSSLANSETLKSKLRELGGEALLAQFQRAAQGAAEAEAAPTPTLEADASALRAAINVRFEESMLPSSENAKLLDRCSAVTVGGVRKLRLNDAARAEVLRAAAASGALGAALADTEAEDQLLLSGEGATESADLTSAWLRSVLRGKPPRLEGATVPQLRAAADGARALSESGDVARELPRVSEIERLLDFAELCQPLEILVGMVPGGRADRFAGRESEMRRLRSFVDVLASKSLLESVSRGFTRAGRGIARALGENTAQGLTLVARGGLGKSTLVAKFALDHFLDARSPLPFVYLDFDRASIQPREPDQLAIEAMRQIAIELPEHAAALEDLRQRFRRRLAERDRSISSVEQTSVPAVSGGGAAALSPDLHAEFGALMRRIAEGSESRAFLLVLDTMEIVQNDPAAVSGIQGFLAALCSEPFGQLRVVAAGRAEIEEFSNIEGLNMLADRMELAALNVTDARAMADKLGRDLMGPAWKPAWAHVIAGNKKDAAERREPLTLRVSVEFIREASTEQREAVVADIGRLGEQSGQDFVGRIYLRRMLEHVRGGEDVKAIAWPGLVARRITKSLLSTVIGPLCGLTPSRADAAFDLLAREVWMVERDEDAIVHRADLRARTLPLMWRQDPAKFRALTLALREHFAAIGEHAEAAYYRLLAGEHPRFLLTEISGDLVDGLAPAYEDFSSNWSPEAQPHAALASAYLRSRTGPLMKQSAFATLPPEFAFSHLARAGTALRGLEDVKVHPMLCLHRGAPAAFDRMSESDRIARQTVLIKTGQWADIDPHLLVRPGEHQEAAALALFVGRAGGGPTWEIEHACDFARALVYAFRPGSAAQAWRIAAFLLPFLKHAMGDAFVRCDQDLAASMPTTLTATSSNRAALRSALIVADTSFVRLAALWAQLAREQSGSGKAETLTGGEVLAVAALMRTSDFEQFHRERQGSQPTSMRILEAVEAQGNEPLPRPLRVEAPTTVLLAEWLAARPERAAEHAGPLRSFFAARDEDWIVPAGYAVHAAAVSDRSIPALSRFFGDREGRAGWDLGWGQSWRGGSSDAPDFSDGIALARRAIELGDLAGLVAHVAATLSAPPETENLGLVHDNLMRWRSIVGTGVATSVGNAAPLAGV